MAAQKPQDGGSAENAWSAMLRQENRYVNAHVRQVPDLTLYGVEENWRRSGTATDAAGDCEDLAIEKRHRLIDRGFPEDRLFFAVVFRRDVGLHVVLVARMQQGDFVLDSLSPYVERWDRMPYSWISVQGREQRNLWFAVNPGAGGSQLRGRGMVMISG